MRINEFDLINENECLKKSCFTELDKQDYLIYLLIKLHKRLNELERKLSKDSELLISEETKQ